MTHELSIRPNAEDEVIKRKTIALKSVANNKDISDELEEIDNENELAMITRKFRRFTRRTKFGFKNKVVKKKQRKGKRATTSLL